MTENEIKKRIEEAQRLYKTATRERERTEGDAEYAADAFREVCDRLITVIGGLQGRIEQLEREAAPLVKPQPKGVKAGCFDI